MSYARFAYVYDDLMRDVNYDSWITFIKEKSLTYNKNMKRILDLACGTGELSIRLAHEGFEVVGVDLSEDMLVVANAKAIEAGVKIDFYQQNMVEIEGLSSLDLVVIFCDSLNYLQTEEEIQKTFRNVYNLLQEGGLFMFDVHSVYKVEQIFLDGTFVSNEEDVSFIWNCYQGPFPYSVEHELSFFVKNNHNSDYQRFDEDHLQRTFPVEQYKKWLLDEGFEILDISADFESAITNDSERIFFTVKK
ncbi:class I SAM-dependent DNA methyltransferase [Ferdinandcohnia quinoae]|uniref:Class I SAM-dependent methyltransferase n=1 Tax=Fredinandcohnia quinoae TaxID=2918902 RepID=A0AAW5DWJ3_9BACI|nr:class I SAM-dependent methyltransferase [Fredinandcohnia sp. SECRCQ15]MCH1625006.1 class I SAM-dependent methyltransferase [Fredinandcohnia sp. SECRCQ15]